MRFWRKHTKGIGGNIVADTTYLLDHREHYEPMFREASVELTNRILAELFLFRAWTTQFAYRIFADSNVHDDLITETVSSCKQLGIALFARKQGFSIEEELNDDFMSLVETRWWAYDDVVVRNKDKDIPTLELCGAFDGFVEVKDLIVTTHLSIDFLRHVRAIRDNCENNRMFKPGRR